MTSLKIRSSCELEGSKVVSSEMEISELSKRRLEGPLLVEFLKLGRFQSYEHIIEVV